MAPFPSTRRTLVAGAAALDVTRRRAAFDALVECYWRPAYKYVRLKWAALPEDAEDLVQGFFSRAFEKRLFDRFDSSRARFRTYLRLCLDGYVQNEQKAAKRLKRGGPAQLLTLDFDDAEQEIVETSLERTSDVDALFYREWIRAVFTAAAETTQETMTASGHATRFELFERYDLHPDEEQRPSYASLAQELGITIHDVTNHLSAARRSFRAVVLATLRSLCVTDEEFRSEARDLLGGTKR